MTILVPQQNLLGAGGILQSSSALALPLQTLNPLSIFSGIGSGASCCSSGYYPQSYCNNNQGIMQMMMGMFAMMMGFMQGMMGSLFNQGQNCGCQNQQQPVIINNIYNDYSDKSVHNTTNKYITNKYTTKNYTTKNQYNTYTTNNTKNNYYDIDTTNIQNNNYKQINNTLNNQNNINNIYDTKVNNTNITDIDNVLNQTFVA